MEWGLALAAGSMVLGAMNAKKQRDMQKRERQDMLLQRAAEQRYSPWMGKAQTGMPNQPTANPLSGALQGAFAGADQWNKYRQMESDEKRIAYYDKMIEKKAEDYAAANGAPVRSGTKSGPIDRGMPSQVGKLGGMSPYGPMTPTKAPDTTLRGPAGAAYGGSSAWGGAGSYGSSPGDAMNSAY